MRSSWVRSGKSFKLRVHIPVGAAARVRVPAEAGAHVSAQAGASRAGAGDSYVAYNVRSGDCTLKVSPRRR